MRTWPFSAPYSRKLNLDWTKEICKNPGISSWRIFPFLKVCYANYIISRDCFGKFSTFRRVGWWSLRWCVGGNWVDPWWFLSSGRKRGNCSSSTYGVTVETFRSVIRAFCQCCGKYFCNEQFCWWQISSFKKCNNFVSIRLTFLIFLSSHSGWNCVIPNNQSPSRPLMSQL